MEPVVASRQQPTGAPVRLPGVATTLADGHLRGVRAGGRDYVIARVGDRWYATVNRCPHLGIKLAGGRLHGPVLECRWHHWRLDLSTGAIDAEESPFATFETYDVTVDGDDLLVAAYPKTRLRRPPGSSGAGPRPEPEGMSESRVTR